MCLGESEEWEWFPSPLDLGFSSQRSGAKLLVWRKALRGVNEKNGWAEGRPRACCHSSLSSPANRVRRGMPTTGESRERKHEIPQEANETRLILLLNQAQTPIKTQKHTAELSTFAQAE